MGIWESLQWTAEAGRRGLADPAAAAIGCAGRAAGAAAGTAAGAATAIVGTGQAVGAAAGGAIGCAGRAVGTAAGTAAGAATAIVGTGQAVGAAAGGAIGDAGRAVGAAMGGAGWAAGAAAEKVVVGASEGARRMQGAMPDREGWETVCRIAWRISDHALAEFTRPYTCGIPVYRYLREELGKGGADNRKQGVAGTMKTKKGAEKPEDVIEDFTTSGFRGGGFINRNN